VTIHLTSELNKRLGVGNNIKMHFILFDSLDYMESYINLILSLIIIVLQAIFPTFSFASHSCQPNCAHSVFPNKTLALQAKDTIKVNLVGEL
jgi:hypothetical protein